MSTHGQHKPFGNSKGVLRRGCRTFPPKNKLSFLSPSPPGSSPRGPLPGLAPTSRAQRPKCRNDTLATISLHNLRRLSPSAAVTAVDPVGRVATMMERALNFRIVQVGVVASKMRHGLTALHGAVRASDLADRRFSKHWRKLSGRRRFLERILRFLSVSCPRPERMFKRPFKAD